MWDTLYHHLRPFFQTPGHILKHVSILDIGCGYGELCASIAEQKSPPEIMGIDHDSHKIETAQTRYANMPNLHFEIATLETRTDIKQHTVLIIDVLHYLNHKDQTNLLKKISASDRVHKIIARDIIKAYHPAYYLNRLHEFIMTRTGRTKVSQTQFSFFTKNQWHQIASDLNMNITIEKSGLPFYNDHLIIFSKP
jgi:uncharacterized protein